MPVGAHSFVERSNEPNAAIAYRQLVEHAQREYGHDPYNGTISTTNGYRIITSEPVGPLVARATIEERLGNLSKWSACEAVSVGRSTATEVHTVWCALDCAHVEPGRLSITADVIAEHLGVAVDRIESFEVLESKQQYSTKTIPAGPTRTVWTTTAGGEFATRAEAVAAAKQQLDRPQSDQMRTTSTIETVRRIEIHKRTIHEPPAAVVKALTAWRVKVNAVVAQGGDRVFDHWLFYGMAAS